MKKLAVTTLVFVLVSVVGCGKSDPVNQDVSSSNSSTVLQDQPEKDCKCFQELAADLRERTDGRHTKIITEDFISQWTYVVMNNSECFNQEQYCQAIYAKNSITPKGRQVSSPYC
jgi:hypothetical protein